MLMSTAMIGFAMAALVQRDDSPPVGQRRRDLLEIGGPHPVRVEQQQDRTIGLRVQIREPQAIVTERVSLQERHAAEVGEDLARFGDPDREQAVEVLVAEFQRKYQTPGFST